MLRILNTLLIFISLSWSMDKPLMLPALHIESFANQKNLDKLYEDIQKLIQEDQVDPQKIAVVLDVNRTLYKNKKEIPGSFDRVRELAKLGVLLVISSANKDFHKTLNKLVKGGLSESLDLPKEVPEKINSETLVFSPDRSLFVYRLGKVASVMLMPQTIRKYIHKAYSVFAVYGEKALRVEYAFFADDTLENQEVFKTQTQKDGALGNSVKRLTIYEMAVD